LFSGCLPPTPRVPSLRLATVSDEAEELPLRDGQHGLLDGERDVGVEAEDGGCGKVWEGAGEGLLPRARRRQRRDVRLDRLRAERAVAPALVGEDGDGVAEGEDVTLGPAVGDEE